MRPINVDTPGTVVAPAADTPGSVVKKKILKKYCKDKKICYNYIRKGKGKMLIIYIIVKDLLGLSLLLLFIISKLVDKYIQKNQKKLKKLL